MTGPRDQPRRLDRRTFVAAGAALGALASGILPRAANAVGGAALAEVSVRSAGRPFAGDGPLLATLSPLGAHDRRRVVLRFRLRRKSTVSFQVVARSPGGDTVVHEEQRTLPPGANRITWQAPPSLKPRTYALHLRTSARGSRVSPPPIVRVLGVDATFTERSAVAGSQAPLRIACDAAALTVSLLHSGPEPDIVYANDTVGGVPVGTPVTHRWEANADAPATVPVSLSSLESGVYFARIDAADGRTGFAPIIVRPVTPTARVAVFMPTSTWQAYNFYDANGDGLGDSWYVRWRFSTLDLVRPYLNRGVPYRYRSYDLGFLRWLHRRGHEADFYADEDLERFTPAQLAAAYDLIVFPGHTEYVTKGMYDITEGYRDLGGNLMLLSANNFFRRVDRRGTTLTLVDTWRKLGRPEARLLGTQYLAGNRGENQQPFVVAPAAAAEGAWAFEGTGLAPGDTFGVFGIEIDGRVPESPPGVVVLATIADSIRRGRTAEMAYYESPSGSRVFSAGVLNFGGQVDLWPQSAKLLENVWRRLTTP